MAKRGERAPRPRRTTTEWELWFAGSEAARGWEQLCPQASANVARFYDRAIIDPRAAVNPERHGRLKGQLSTASIKGEAFEQWQFEVTAGGRVWYAIDDAKRVVWITLASVGHPKATE